MENPYESLKVLHHPEKIKSLLEGKVTAPIYVRVKPTNECNHRCLDCYFDPENENNVSEKFKRHDKIPREKMMEILNDFKEIGVKAVTYSGGGEPLIYPYIEETLEKTLKNGIDLSSITNGQRLNGRRAELLSQAKWVRVSANTNNSKTFSKIRRVKESLFYELTENIRNFARIKKPECELGINFVVCKENSSQVYDSVKFFKNLGVNHVKITPSWRKGIFFEYHAPIKEKVLEQINRAKEELEQGRFKIYDTYENDFNMSGVDERKYLSCCMMQILPVIAADSNIYTCHDKAYSIKGKIGFLEEQSFKDLWFGQEAKKFFNTFNPQEKCDHYCTNDRKNVFIKDILEKVRKGKINLENLTKGKEPPMHVNFI